LPDRDELAPDQRFSLCVRERAVCEFLAQELAPALVPGGTERGAAVSERPPVFAGDCGQQLPYLGAGPLIDPLPLSRIMYCLTKGSRR